MTEKEDQQGWKKLNKPNQFEDTKNEIILTIFICFVLIKINGIRARNIKEMGSAYPRGQFS